MPYSCFGGEILCTTKRLLIVGQTPTVPPTIEDSAKIDEIRNALAADAF